MALQGEGSMVSSSINSFSKLQFLSCLDETDPSLYRLLDAPPTPDLYYTDNYAAQHKGSGKTIVIDNGISYL